MDMKIQNNFPKLEILYHSALISKLQITAYNKWPTVDRNRIKRLPIITESGTVPPYSLGNIFGSMALCNSSTLQWN